jgi:hypothetical protein
MPSENACRCLLCEIESRLLASLGSNGGAPPGFLVSGRWCAFPSVPDLLRILRTPLANAASDELLRGLFRLGATEPSFIEELLILVFVPMLHRTIRRVARYQPALTEDDITQQALSFLLEVLRSEKIRVRESHFAFAIARAVKREVFAWAAREGMREALLLRDGEVLSHLAEESFEPHAQLCHFLHRCTARGDLTASELDVLIELKLEGSNAARGARSPSSNAGRQKLKRVMAKLRRLAGRDRTGQKFFSCSATHFPVETLNR